MTFFTVLVQVLLEIRDPDLLLNALATKDLIYWEFAHFIHKKRISLVSIKRNYRDYVTFQRLKYLASKLNLKNRKLIFLLITNRLNLELDLLIKLIQRKVQIGENMLQIHPLILNLNLKERAKKFLVLALGHLIPHLKREVLNIYIQYTITLITINKLNIVIIFKIFTFLIGF